MELSKEEFDHQFKETLDGLIGEMASHSDVNVKNFYKMTCILENLAFFSPVLYDFIKKRRE